MRPRCEHWTPHAGKEASGRTVATVEIKSNPVNDRRLQFQIHDAGMQKRET